MSGQSEYENKKAVLTDAKGIAKVHVDSWKTTYTNIVPDAYLNSLDYEGRNSFGKILYPLALYM
ncbi:hypothetical protein F4694_003889 [Bacillus niacini]|uniref:Uncharacterized protein n=1 Tax=Neobacillus niacini TaxID=86668 RepID=A0A852TJ18_9BACI|nr:hypothetical protein [Neobacillus niacini]NYE07104.1 hypothetical protein [Neobacillus niacini]